MLKERYVQTGVFEREQIERILGHLPSAIRPAAQFADITGWRIPSEVLNSGTEPLARVQHSIGRTGAVPVQTCASVMHERERMRTVRRFAAPA